MGSEKSGPHAPRGPLAFTLAVGVLSFVLAILGLPALWPEAATPAAVIAALPELLYEAAKTLTLNGSEAAPDGNVAYRAAQLLALIFGASVVATTLLTFSKIARARWIGARSSFRPDRAHAIVFGLGEVGASLVRDIRGEGGDGRGREVIVVEEDADRPGVGRAVRQGALVLHEDARSRGIRRRARLHVAGEALVTSEDDEWNLEVAVGIARDVQPRPGGRRLRCYVHVDDARLSQTIRERGPLADADLPVDFRFFSLRENIGRDLMLEEDRGLARRYSPATHEVAHYVLFGFGPTGQAVALQMARLAHFANGRRLRLTIVDEFGGDPASARAPRAFLDRHPGFGPDLTFGIDEHLAARGDVLDRWSYRGARPRAEPWRYDDDREVVEYAVNAEFLDLPTEVDAPDLIARLGGLFAPGTGPPVRPGAVVCFEDEHRNFESAVRLRDGMQRLLPEDVPAGSLPIFAFLSADEELAELIGSSAEPEARFPLHSFGVTASCAGYDAVVRPALTRMAACFHAAYLRGEAEGWSVGGAPSGVSVSQEVGTGPDEEMERAFRELSADFQISNEEAAAHADVKLDAVGYRATASDGEPPPQVVLSAGEVERLARMEHNRWMAERLVGGWRFGRARDDERRLRPGFRTWERIAESPDGGKDLTQIETLVRAYNLAGRVLMPAPGRDSGTTEATGAAREAAVAPGPR